MIDQVDEDRAVPASAPPSPLVDAHGDWGRCDWNGGTAYQAPQRGRAGLLAQLSGESSTSLATKRQANVSQGSYQASGFAGIACDQIGQTLGEAAARTLGIAAHELAHPQLQTDLQGTPGDIGQMALFATMDGGRGGGAERTSSCCSRRG